MMKKRAAPSATTGVSKDHKGEVRIELPIIMTCSACSITLDRSLRALDGVSEANVNYAFARDSVQAAAVYLKKGFRSFKE